MSEPCPGWIFDFSCLENWDAWSEADRELASALASDLMRAWTLGLYGGCPVTVRPENRGCCCPVVAWGAGPYATCSCPDGTQLWLGAPVGSVSIVQDGAALDPSAYRIDLTERGYVLTRLDGQLWPRSQDLTKPLDAEGTFAITYTPGYAISAAGQRAGAVLAGELVKLGKPGEKCRLPDNVTNIVRQGVTMSLEQRDLAHGVTGIREIDLYLATVNPNRLTRAPAVWSPDLDRFRLTVPDA